MKGKSRLTSYALKMPGIFNNLCVFPVYCLIKNLIKSRLPL